MQFVTKLGRTRAGERTRIWIEGNRLIEAGFNVGDHFAKTWNSKSLLLERSRERTFAFPIRPAKFPLSSTSQRSVSAYPALSQGIAKH